MKIKGNCIEFKSTPENYHKEKNGLKPCTARTIVLRSEFKEFVKFYEEFEQLPNKSIEITNTVTGESFTRRLTDISEFEHHFIFSWEPERKI